MGMWEGPLRGMGVYIDCFTAPTMSLQGVTLYFLTHFHVDHMAGLREGWARGPLYCSHITPRLLAEVAMVDPKVVHARSVDHPFELIDPVTHAKLTELLVDAGQCPGSVMVVLEGFSDGAVSTGDF